MDDVRPDSCSTLQLLDRVSAGDSQAIGALLERHFPRVRADVGRRLDRRVQSRLDSSDVIQETQLEAVRRMDEYLAARPMPFHLWLKRLTHQSLLKAERRHLATAKRTVDREVPLPDQTSLHLIAGIVREGRSPESEAVRKEKAQAVRRLLARLSEADREVIMLRNFDGLSNGEAACLLDVSLEAAKKRYTRALLRLEQLLRDAGLTGADQ